MIYYNGQIVNPEKFRLPSYYISPFNTGSLATTEKIISTHIDCNDIVEHEFGTFDLKLSAKEAIFCAMSYYDLGINDEVYIVTSTGNLYVSSCVTSEIEKYCRWSRKLSGKTKLIFVIHEFGMIYPDMDALVKLNIPIIEDLAMSLFSKNESNLAGKYGDFAIYSLPKFFPIQYGGVLSYNNDKFLKSIDTSVSKSFFNNLITIINYYLNKRQEIIAKRKENYNLFKKLFNNIGINTRLDLKNLETPSVFMFSSNRINFDALKVFLQSNGIECSKFYGEESFFIPVHQNLNEFDINYIFNLIKYFIDEN